jgi:hypothetical protein
MSEKFQVNLSSGRSLKRQNTQNTIFLLCRVITKIRGVDGKSPLINAKHDYNISKHLNMSEYASINYKLHAWIFACISCTPF